MDIKNKLENLIKKEVDQLEQDENLFSFKNDEYFKFIEQQKEHFEPVKKVLEEITQTVEKMAGERDKNGIKRKFLIIKYNEDEESIPTATLLIDWLPESEPLYHDDAGNRYEITPNHKKEFLESGMNYGKFRYIDKPGFKVAENILPGMDGLDSEYHEHVFEDLEKLSDFILEKVAVLVAEFLSDGI